MNPQDMIRTFCRYMETLLEERRKNETPGIHTLWSDLKLNLLSVLTAAKNDPAFHSALSSCFQRSAEITDDDFWDVVLLCLILIKGINEALLLQENITAKGEAEIGTSVSPHEEIEPLSINQENIIKKCLQFVVALGILPGLTSCIKNAFRRQTEALKIVENLHLRPCPRIYYYILVSCLCTLLECLQSKYLRSLVLKNHSGHILLVLLQLCFAPLKLGSDASSQPIFEFTIMSDLNKNTPVEDRSHAYDKYRDLNWLLSQMKICQDVPEKQFVEEILSHRRYFMCCLNKFLSEVHPSVVMWELLLLQGSCSGDGTKDSVQKKSSLPSWLKRICDQLLIDNLLKPFGVNTFIQLTLDKFSDLDIKAGTLSKQRIEAVAKIMTHIRATHIPLESYMEGIAQQALELIHSKDEHMSRIFSTTASFITLQFAEVNFEMTEKCISHNFFSMFWKILSDKSLFFDGERIVSEEELTACILDAHEIFVASGIVLSEEAVKLLFPFFHLLFVMHTKLQSGISFLKSKLQDLLVTVLNKQDKDMSFLLLRLAVFEDVKVERFLPALHIKCVFGDTGGIEIVKSSEESFDGDLVEDIELRCQAVLQLLNEISDKKIKVSFFLFLLKKATHFQNKEATVSEHFQNKEAIVSEETTTFISSIISIHLLENLLEIIGEDLVDSIDEALDMIKDALECTVSCEEQPFSEESMLTFLVILSTVIGYEEQLTSSHWNALNKCVPLLEKLISSENGDVLKSIAQDICITVRTHGAVHDFDKKNSNLSSKSFSELQKEMMQFAKTLTGISLEESAEKQETLDSVRINSMSKGVSNGNTHMLHNEKVLNARESSHFSSNSLIQESDCVKNVDASDVKGMKSEYEIAMDDAKNISVPIKGHGLIALCRLLEYKGKEIFQHKEDIFILFQESLMHDDSYIYLPAIRGMSLLADINVDVLHFLLSEFRSNKTEKWDQTLKIGEVLLKICQKLGDLTPKYRDQFLSTYLSGTRHEDPHIRASSLSNLGEVCKQLRFSIGPWLQEILLCITSLLKTDSHCEVRRSAILVIRLLLQGTGQDAFVILESGMKELYSTLRMIYKSEKADDIVKLQAHLALDEVNHIVKNCFEQKPQLSKEIRILHPF